MGILFYSLAAVFENKEVLKMLVECRWWSLMLVPLVFDAIRRRPRLSAEQRISWWLHLYTRIRSTKRRLFCRLNAPNSRRRSIRHIFKTVNPFSISLHSLDWNDIKLKVRSPDWRTIHKLRENICLKSEPHERTTPQRENPSSKTKGPAWFSYYITLMPGVGVICRPTDS